MSVVFAVLAAAAMLVWPLRHSAPLAWPPPAGSAAPFPGPSGSRAGWSRPGGASRRRRRFQDAADLLVVVEGGAPGPRGRTDAWGGPRAGRGGGPAGGVPRSTPLLVSRLASLSAAQGLPIGPLWAEAAAAAESRLHLLARTRAGGFTEDLGAPLAEAMRTTAGLLRARVRAEQRTAGAVAGARATMNVLTALPFGGPLVAVALGIGPRVRPRR